MDMLTGTFRLKPSRPNGTNLYIIIIMHIYRALINALSAHIMHINLNMLRLHHALNYGHFDGTLIQTRAVKGPKVLTCTCAGFIVH